MKKITGSVILALFLICGLTVGEGKATSVTYELSRVFNGSTPTSTSPWLTAVFDDSGGIGSVTLTLTPHLNVTGEFFRSVVFNVNPSITPSDLIITSAASNSVKTEGIVNKKQNEQDLTSLKGFDIMFEFATANKGNRFEGNDYSLIYTISLTGITANSFAFQNTGSAHLFVGAKVQGIPADKSGEIGSVAHAPIPGAVWLLGSGLLGLLGLRRKFVR